MERRADAESTRAVLQHVVPQVYLKRFTDKRTHKLLLMRRPGAGGLFVPPRLVTVKTAAAQDDFYTFLDADGQRNTAIESRLSAFEGRYKLLYKDLRAQSGLSEEARANTRVLTSLQYGRGLTQRDFMIRWFSLEALGGSSEFLKANPNCSIDEIEAYLASAPDAKDLRSRAIDFARQAIWGQSSAILRVINTMNMCVLTSKAHDFFTNDQPVVFFDPTAGAKLVNRYVTYPYLRLSMEVTYPLTKRHCAFFSWMPIPRDADATTKIVTAINSRTAYTCVRDVFYTPSLLETFHDRFPSDMTDKVERHKPLLWTYMNKSCGEVTLQTAIRECNLDEADVMSSYKIPFWWFHGFTNMEPEFKAAIIAAEEKQRSLDGW